jgi:hypothetical protein
VQQRQFWQLALVRVVVGVHGFEVHGFSLPISHLSFLNGQLSSLRGLPSGRLQKLVYVVLLPREKLMISFVRLNSS